MDEKVVDIEHSSRDEVVVATILRVPMPDILAKMTDEERMHLETRLRRKMDWRLLPILIFLYIMNYIDRSVNLEKSRIVIGSHMLTASRS
jgi:hypothetical protein